MTGRHVRALLVALVPVLVLVLVPVLAAPVAARTPDSGIGPASRTIVRLDGVRVGLPAGSRQVVTVNHTVHSRARVTLWQRDAAGWRIVARTKAGRTGYGGLVAARLRKQATGTTPLGTFGLLSAFGTHPRDARWDLGYRPIRAGDYWVEDNASTYYNRYRNKSEGGFRWWLPKSDDNSSERLRDFATQYEYAIVTGFNYANPVRHRGAGIFLHVNGRGATAGCVSAPRWFLQRTMATLDPDLRPVIAVGR
jgi:L,D-peptidoglycan transpeptidase YkuD (ErfK/YbiS/YcfS/YnhG family)